MLLADIVAHDWVDTIVKLVTAGGFGALVWYLVVKHIPSIEDRHQHERDEWREFIDKRDESFEKIVKEFSVALLEVRREIAELRGDISRRQ